MSTAASGRLRVLGDPGSLDPRALAAGSDLVLHASPAQASGLAQGTLIDDWLDGDARGAVDAEANAALEAWRARCDAALTVDGVRLGWLFAGELAGDVFLREARVLAGVRAAVSQLRPRAVELRRVDPALGDALAGLLDELGVAVAGVHEPAPPPRYPIEFRRSAGERRALLAAARETLGMPGRVRGAVLIKPYWHLEPLWARLLATPGSAPVMDPFDPPRLARAEILAIARGGGWIGHPGARARRRSRRLLASALAACPPAADGRLDALAAIRATALLEQRARDALADVGVLRAAFGRRGLRAAVLPSDGTAVGRAVLTAAREAGATGVQVQHGFFGDLWRFGGRQASYIDGLEADRVGVWSERQAEALGDAPRGTVTVTGNPGAARFAHDGWPGGRAADPRSAVVLVQPPIGGTSAIDVRAPARHVGRALAGLAQAGVDEVVLRPHPLDGTDYGGLPGARAAKVTVDRARPIESVLAGARICVGPLSTATLQSAAAGIPTVFLDTIGRPLPWPFDGSGALARASDADELAAATTAALAAASEPSAAALEALGARPDALQRVVDLVLGGA